METPEAPIMNAGIPDPALPAEEAPAPPAEAAPVAAPAPAPADTAASVAVAPAASVKEYPSLYDTKSTTVVAILLGILIIGGIQYMVHRIFAANKNEHKALTQFVTSMVALVIGAYLCDLIVSGPATSLMTAHEHNTILAFVKDVCLMVFAYYFGTKAGGSPKEE